MTENQRAMVAANIANMANGGDRKSDQRANLPSDPDAQTPHPVSLDQAYAMWLACATQQEIAEAVDVTRQTVATWEDDFAKNSAAEDFANSRDFDPPIYNVWKQQTKTNAVGHFGNSEARWVG